ncbi:HEXXH motif-containing protein [Lentzea albidocapillata subsp. violacea]|uniref:HEXXH motif-containing protein n=1 Tax=Lentzea albidocapillata subsp. violacea TaxID=128104 RepID=A0A1G9QWF1_9PSEU|nr:HEXXH motif domain-containing protein [Lentzea albidocapillata]SDM15346.1 HEXXH motif-containing protein [Lentzea albidocapillata subsp. violacea]
MLTPHRLPPRFVDQLARGGGDDAVLTLLSDGQFSARLVALRALLDEVSGRSLLLEVGEAWDLLVEAQRKSPGLVRETLLLPQVGVWLTDVLRSLRGTIESAAPLWVDVGHLRCVAVVAAHLSDLDFSLDVPVSRGVISLPSLGVATFPEVRTWAVARAERRAGVLSLSLGARTIRVPDDEDWLPVRRIGAGGFTPLLDDVEPHRDYRAASGLHRLTDAEVGHWEQRLRAAWPLLRAEHAEALRELVSTMVPVPPRNGGTPYSGSSADAYGAVLMSVPPDSFAFAETLTHEVQHTKLAALTTIEPLCTVGGSAYCYAPWRDDPRPVSGLFQGVYAFLGVTDFWRAHRETDPSERADFEFAYWCGQTLHAARFLRGCRELTALGRRFATIVAARLASWSRIRVGATAAHTARVAARDHRATWLARHLTPEPAAVERLAEDWLAGRPRGELPVSALTPRPASPLPRMELRRLLPRTPSGFTGATAADLRHLAGDQDAAARLYAADIAANPDDVSAWIGLGLADPSARALLRVPAVVMAVHAEILRRTGEFPDPRVLAAWVGR